MGIMISVAGAIKGCGCTHFTISLANALKKRSRSDKIAITDRIEQESLTALGEELGILKEHITGDFYTYHGIDYFLKKFGIAAFKEYDYVIADYGTMPDEEFFRADICILIIPSRKWNRGRKEIYEICHYIDKNIDLSNVIIISPFADKDAQKEIKKVFATSKIIFTDIETDPLNNPLINVSDIVGKPEKKGFFTRRLKKEMVETDIDDVTEKTESDENTTDTGTIGILTTDNESHSFPREENKEAIDLIEEHEVKEELNEVKEEVKDSKDKIIDLMSDLLKLQMLNSTKESTIPVDETDELTGLPNRKGFKRYITEMDESGKGYAIIFFDVNNLKKTNDTLGHAKGDILLTTVANEIKKKFTNLYRVGGDEFNAVIPITEFNSQYLDDIDKALKEITQTRNDGIIFETAHGYALSTEAFTLSDVMSLADQRMYEDKKRKKAVIQTVSETSDETKSIMDQIVESMFPIENVIPGTLPFGDDEPLRKTLDTMWFTRIKLSFEHNGYKEVNLWVFATDYAKPPLPVNNIVVLEDGDGYIFAYGKNTIIRTGNSVFMVNARFKTEGRLSVSIIPQNDEIKITHRIDDENIGNYTPKHFGLLLDNIEIYPLKQNLDGLCDCILLKDNDVFLSSGNLKMNGNQYDIVLEKDCLIVTQTT